MIFYKRFLTSGLMLMIHIGLCHGHEETIVNQELVHSQEQEVRETEQARQNEDLVSQMSGEQHNEAAPQSHENLIVNKLITQGLWDNKGFINHTIGDISTVLARLIFHNPTMELVESSYRWLSGGYMWYESDQQRQAHPSQLMDIKNMAVLAHLGADALDVLFTYMPGILESIPGGAYVEGGVQLTAGLTYFTIAGITGYLTYEKIQTYKQAKKKKDQ